MRSAGITMLLKSLLPFHFPTRPPSHHHHLLLLHPPVRRSPLSLPGSLLAASSRNPSSSFASFRRCCTIPVCETDPTTQSRPQCGEIHVITGPMFAGKTTSLLCRVRAEQSRGRSVAVIKSDKDTRYGLDAIVTHDGRKMPCFALSELSLFRERLGVEAYNKLDVIGIDEAQFFDDLFDFCCNAADRDRKTVIVAGLDGDYLRRRFGSVLDIIPLADTVTKLAARCGLCGASAFFTQRKTKETQTELIGGADVYMPVCRQHYLDGQIVVEATRIVLDAEQSAVV